MAITYIPSNQVNIAEALNPIVEALKYRWMKEAAKKEKKTELAKLGITEQPDYQQALQAQGINFQPLQGEVSPLEQQRMASKYSKVSGGKTVPEQFMRYNLSNVPEGMDVDFGDVKFKKQSTMKPIFVMTENGVQQIGEVPKGSQVATPYQMQTPQQRQEAALKTAEEKSKIITPSENERAFLADYPQAKKDMEDLLSKLTPETKAPLGGFARIATGKRYLVPEKKLKELQEPYTRILKTFLFGPAGKALTGTERQVLEDAATPTGKSPQEWERDILAAYGVINRKNEMLSSRKLPDNNNPIENNIQNNSNKVGRFTVEVE